MPQLSLAHRSTIEQLLQKGCSQSAIARQLGVHRSTIKRELDRNSKEGTYRATDAHCQSSCRKKLAGFLSQFGNQEESPQPKAEPALKGIRNNVFPKNHHSTKAKNLLHSRNVKRRLRDLRPWYQRPNHYRSIFYKLWKKSYETVYRLRDYHLAEVNRSRSPLYFFFYLRPIREEWYRRHLAWERMLIRFRRENYAYLLQKTELANINRRLDLVEEFLLANEEVSKPEVTETDRLRWVVFYFLGPTGMKPVVKGLWGRAYRYETGSEGPGGETGSIGFALFDP